MTMVLCKKCGTPGKGSGAEHKPWIKWTITFSFEKNIPLEKILLNYQLLL